MDPMCPASRPASARPALLPVLPVLAALSLVASACSGDGGAPAARPAGASSATSAVPTVDPGPDPTTSPLTPATGVPPAEAAAGRAAVRRYADATLAVLGGTRTSRAELRRAAAGDALSDLLTQRQEYAERRWRVDGQVEVVDQTVVSRRDDPPRLRVAACVDTSAVRVRDRSGAVVPTSSTPRTLDLLTVERRGGGWVVVATTLPDDPSC